MRILVSTVLILIAVPSVAQAWSLRPAYFPPLLDTESNAVGFLKRHEDLANRMFEATDRLFQQSSPFPSSPRFELIDDDEKFEVSLDVPGVKPEDMTISLERDGYITIRGERVAKTENSRYASRFSQTFSLDPAIDVNSVTANLDSGVLIISAVKDANKITDHVRRIPITSGKALHGTAPEAVAKEVTGKKGEPLEIQGKLHSEEQNGKMTDLDEIADA